MGESRDGDRGDSSGEALGLLLAESPAVVYRREAAPPYRFTFVSDNVERLFGIQAEELYRSPEALRRRVFADDALHLDEALSRVGEEGRRVTYRVNGPGDARRWIQDRMRLVPAAGGQPASIVGHLEDVTERQAIVDELVRSEERHALAVQGAQAGLWDLDVPSGRLFLSPLLIEMLGYDEDEIEPYVELAFLLDHLHPDDRDGVEAALRAHLEGRGAFSIECRAYPLEGDQRWFHLCGQANWVGDLEPARVAGWISDITARRRLEEELRQAQKMEAIGRLAGGVAHDFNNLLSVILACAQLVGNELPEGHPAADDAREIALAARRAASLTRQLLAFSRQQRMEPRVVELREAIANVEGMLRRLIGEDIELDTTGAIDERHIRIDPGQLEQVVLNLVVNARDAMPDGGRIAVWTGEVDALPPDATMGAPDPGAGPFVVLGVSDAGHGMDAATRARIFDPFFTTKELGKGTGLGLSTVYGIVAQSGGRIGLDSTPGRGTTFRLYFARSQPSSEVLEDEPEAALAEAPPAGAGRTLLLAEDDDQLRGLAQRVLEGEGYRVLAGRDAREALELAGPGEHGAPPPPIDLLVSDIVMPGQSGPQLYRRLLDARPSLPALFLSGHADRQAMLLEGADVLAKPFTADDLLARVRARLEEPEPPGAGPDPLDTGSDDHAAAGGSP